MQSKKFYINYILINAAMTNEVKPSNFSIFILSSNAYFHVLIYIYIFCHITPNSFYLWVLELTVIYGVLFITKKIYIIYYTFYDKYCLIFLVLIFFFSCLFFAYIVLCTYTNNQRHLCCCLVSHVGITNLYFVIL